MAEQIKDGTGTSRLAGVNPENRLMISGPTVSQEHYTNFTFQDSYNMLFDVTPVGASDVFLYLKNEHALPIVCEGYSIRCASDEIVTITLGVLGTPVGGADAVPANLFAGSGNQAIGTFQTGNDITGLSGGVTCLKYYIAGSNDSAFRNFDADIVIPQNQVLIMTALTGAIALSGFMVFWHDHGDGGS